MKRTGHVVDPLLCVGSIDFPSLPNSLLKKSPLFRFFMVPLH